MAFTGDRDGTNRTLRENVTSNSPGTHSRDGHPWAMPLVGLGVVLVLIQGLVEVDLLWGLPRFLYQNRVSWWAVSIGLLAYGLVVLGWDHGEVRESGIRWRPSRPGIRFCKVVLYTRAGCHLCEDARQVLADHSRWMVDYEERSVDDDPSVQSLYGTCVPVILIDERVRFRGRVETSLLRRLIEASPVQNDRT